jgi:hypothetical protein
MLDEVALPKDPELYICPCCKFSFRAKDEKGKYVAHLEKMKTLIDAELKKVKRG